jgi:GntR family transcriptional regulator/MocR family aminotransferase
MERATVMEVDEANWLYLEPRKGETLRGALERILREAILSGVLREGVKLPPSRALAREFGVSRGVVTDAYEQLEAQGFLVTRPRAATLVAPIAQRDADGHRPEPQTVTPRYDFTPTTPDVTLFPLSHWLGAAQHVARKVPSATLGYGEPQGERALRDALADHLGRTRGVIADPEQLLIVQGTAQGIDLILRVLLARGASRFAVEDPSHTSQHQRIRALGFELHPQPVDDDGLMLAGLDADAVLVTPAHQFPAGCVLSGERRRELITWSRTTDGLIVEDDYDSEFRYDREPVRTLQGLAPEHVVQIGTVSKTLVPALRLGWLVVPPYLIEEARRAKWLLDDFSPALDQLTFAELLRRGHYDRHVRRARKVYRARRDRLISALETWLPELTIEGVAAGVHLLLRLPGGVDDRAVADAARQMRIAVSPLSSFQLTPAPVGGLVIGYGSLRESAVEEATRALAEVIRTQI